MSSDVMAQIMNQNAKAMGYGMGGYAFNAANEAMQNQMIQEASMNQADLERKRALTAQTQLQTDIMGKEEAAYGDLARQAKAEEARYKQEDFASGRAKDRQMVQDQMNQFKMEADRRTNRITNMLDAATVARKTLQNTPMMDQETWAGVVRPNLEKAGYTDLPQVYTPDILPLLDQDIKGLQDQLFGLDKIKRELEVREPFKDKDAERTRETARQAANQQLANQKSLEKVKHGYNMERDQARNANKLAVQTLKNAAKGAGDWKSKNVQILYGQMMTVLETGKLPSGEEASANDLAQAKVMVESLIRFKTINKDMDAASEEAMTQAVMSGDLAGAAEAAKGARAAVKAAATEPTVRDVPPTPPGAVGPNTPPRGKVQMSKEEALALLRKKGNVTEADRAAFKRFYGEEPKL